MTYIWNEYSDDKKYRVSTSRISPYLETWADAGKTVPVNIYVRLYELLVPGKVKESAEMLNKLLEHYERDKKYQDILNTVMHYIARLDRYKGITVQDVWAMNVKAEILSEHYGTEARQDFEKIKPADQMILCRYIAKYDMLREREMQLDAALKALFLDVRIYYEESLNIIRIYIDRIKNEYNENLFYTVCRFLKDIDIVVEVYWKREHFGIIGIEETMQIDKTALF